MDFVKRRMMKTIRIAAKQKSLADALGPFKNPFNLFAPKMVHATY
jgi:hypothetical protein